MNQELKEILEKMQKSLKVIEQKTKYLILLKV